MADHDARVEHTLEPPRHGHSLGHATPDGPIGIVTDLLSHAGADPVQLAEIVQTFPHARDEVMSLLHRTLGAGFVREVVAKLAAPTAGETVALTEIADAPARRYRVSANGLNVRSSPDGHGHNIVGALHHDAIITTTGGTGAWLRIDYHGQPAFVHGQFVEPADHEHDDRGDADGTVQPEDLHALVQEAAPATTLPDHEPAHPREAPQEDGIIGGLLHAKSADTWKRSNHDVTSVFPPELAALYDDCIAHVKAGTLVFPKKNKNKLPPPPATSEPFERFVHAFYKHFHVNEKRINLEITSKGGDHAKAYYIRDYLESQLGAPLAQHSTHGAQRVHHKAEAAFLAMHEAAAKDGVQLKIVSGYRPPTDPTIPSNADPMAKASNSSHNYGLAIDFQLSVDKHHAEEGDQLRVKECDTKNMTNFMSYYGSSVAKWLVLNAAKFDFHPYSMEPWHFEYNPAGMAQEILDGVKASKR